MKIVIDIPEEIYNRATRGFLEGFDIRDLRYAIKNGTPLPKGHRRLIAEPTEEDIAKTVGGKNDFAECIRDAVRMTFANAPTILKADADKESEQ